MANAKYPKFLQALLNKEHNFSSDTIKAALIDTDDYTYDAAHTSFTTHVPSGAVVASVSLTTPSITDGVFDTLDFSWLAVSGDQCEAVQIYNDTHASKGLAAYYDSGMVGMPVTPNGGNVNATIHSSGWFAL